MDEDNSRIRYISFLTLLIICALLLSARMVYLYLADPLRFPINTVKISATYQHVKRKQIELVLSDYLNESFVLLPVDKLKTSLGQLSWVGQTQIERVWPDILKINLTEKLPVAFWNGALITEDGESIEIDKEQIDMDLPRLIGPKEQQLYVLQMYQKLSKLLEGYRLGVEQLKLRDNQAYELILTNGVILRLGKRDLEQRLMRFCKAWPVVFAEKHDQLASVDLRYARGMAVLWKQQTGK